MFPEAHAQAQEAQSICPPVFFEYFPKTVPFKAQPEIERILDALRKAELTREIEIPAEIDEIQALITITIETVEKAPEQISL